MHEYDLIADWYAGDRSRSIGVSEALAALKALPLGALVLDVGCGNGVPVTDALVTAGYRAVGLDTSARMLARFRLNLSQTPVVRGDARACPFADATFDASISWGLLFHLTPREQVTLLTSISRVLKPGAPFLFTGAEIAGVDDDTNAGITGTMNGVTFRYWAVASYRPLLSAAGFELESVYDDPDVSTYYSARKLR
jgi:SAM-dependent methyltransferase